MELKHHGVKGQKWGVRRYQDKNGKLTPEGKVRQVAIRRVRSAAKTKKDVDSITNSMSKKDKAKLMDSDEYLSIEAGEFVVKRFLHKNGNIPVSFFDLLSINEPGYEKTLNAAIGTRSGSEFRGKGYANKCVEKGVDWFDKNKDRLGYTEIQWWALADNIGSRRLAEKNGFILDTDRSDDEWVRYTRH